MKMERDLIFISHTWNIKFNAKGECGFQKEERGKNHGFLV
jgi:hypothetical protein